MTLAAQGLAVPGRLEGIDAVLRAGEITAICGPNGAGKSTLLQCLAGLLLPRAGTVTLDGRPLAELAPRLRGQALGYLPQEPQIAWDVAVRRLVALGRLPFRDAGDGVVDAVIERLDLARFAARPVSTLSGGERARVLLARVLAGTPRWILADEPLAALDLAHQQAILRHLRDAAREGAGVVMVLHDLALARNHADRVLVLDEGRLAADAGPDTALEAGRVAQVWRTPVAWIGGPGAWALVPGDPS